MQTKKRAKPVKFEGKKEEVADKKEQESVPVVAHMAEEKSGHAGHGIEAHFSTTTETLDIVENLDVPTVEPNVNEEPPEVVESSSTVAQEQHAVVDKAADDQVEVQDTPQTVVSVPEENNEVEAVPDVDGESVIDNSSENEQEVTEDKGGAFFNRPPDEYDNSSRSRFPYFLKVFIITFIVGLAFFAGIYYAISSKAITFPTSEKKETEVTKAPTPTEKPVDLKAYTIKVLNGTATAGMAAKLKISLTDGGFKVNSAGNADNADFTKTEIGAKKTVDKAYLVKLKEFLAKTYDVAVITEIPSGVEDVVVTIGSASAK